MITIIFMWIYQLLLILPYGFFLISLWIGKSSKVKPDVSTTIVAFLIGLTFLTTITSFFSLLVNIGWQVHSIVLISSLSLWFYLIRHKKIPIIQIDFINLNKVQWISLGLLLVSILIILFSASTAPENPDTGIYHAQAIRWIETYKAIPGLGNLHARFAYNSSWLVINALFSLSFLKIQSFHILPSLLFLVGIIYFYSGIFEVSGGSRKLSDIMKYGFFMASFLFLRTEISSPGTDLPVTLILWIISSEWLSLMESGDDSTNYFGIWLAIIAVFCTTIKLSSAPILLLLVWLLVKEFRKKRIHSIFVLCSTIFFILAPFIGRNIILSGHLFYPGLKADPIHVDWSIPTEWVEIEKYTIHSFALLPREDKEDIADMTWQLQYKKWLFNEIPRHKAMLAFLVVTPILMLGLLPFKKWRNQLNKQKFILWPILTFYSGVIFWLITAPSFRFGYGFILATIALLTALLGQFFISEFGILRVLFPPMILLVLFLILLNSGKGSIHSETLVKRILLPLDYPNWKTETCQFGNFSIQCATEWASCWYDPFPCAIKGVPNVEMRGESYSDGFQGIP